MAAVDIVSASEQAGWRACMRARDRGVFVRPLGDTVVVMPPLSIEENELAQICEAVRYGLDCVARSTTTLG
jgi:adenosylmethionine-8-amino-7-oxononanoate aminotransferase